MIISILREGIFVSCRENQMKLRLSLFQKENILCSHPALPDGNQILPGLQWLKRFLAIGSLSEIHAGVQKMKTKSLLAPRAHRFFRYRAKKMHSFTWATDGYRKILLTAGISVSYTHLTLPTKRI